MDKFPLTKFGYEMLEQELKNKAPVARHIGFL